MDSNNQQSASSPSKPPIPQRTHRHSSQHQSGSSIYARRRSLQGPAPLSKRSTAAGEVPPAPAPASPEVISSLITSLSVISKPADRHFEGQPLTSLSLPGSPRSPSFGSFGVDYGAYSQPSLGQLREEESVALDELAASAPIIRTAKPPSGYSHLTAPKSPRDGSGSFRSFLRSSSRPSSKGSQTSRDDAQSIGNVSIERGTAPASGAESSRSRSRSRDSWVKKQSRSHKGLMYMSSKERLREKEYERKRASVGAVGGSEDWASATSTRPDPFLAETAISEEPAPGATIADSSSRHAHKSGSQSMETATSPRSIPNRESSLRKTGNNAKRSSGRNSKSKRDSEGLKEAILEVEEQGQSRNSQRRTGRKQSSNNSVRDPSQRPTDLLSAGTQSPANVQISPTRQFDTTHAEPDNDLEDGAPFPAVSQGRRRDHSADQSRIKAGRHTPDPVETARPKRSSSRLKRLSAPTSPREETDGHSSGNRGEVRSPELSMPAGYERPQSADSIDDAVESYLCSPRLSQKIKHPQTGRVISFSEVGDADGFAVFCCVGMGLTRYITAFYDELALTLKLRLITPDRPGVGDSESYGDGTATPLSWPDDVYAICQSLKITKFSILAHSAGAIYALATALRMPQHIRGRIHLLAPWIPPSQMNVFGTSQNLPPTNAIPTSQRILRALPTPFLKAANSSFMSATSSSITSSLPKTPRRKRKSTTAAAGRDRDSAPRRDVTPSLDKENIGQQGHNGKNRDRTPADVEVSKGSNTTDNMRLTHQSSTRQLARESDGASQAIEDADDAVLAAAADALAEKERQVTYDSRLMHAIWDLATTGANPAVDLLVCLERRHTIGFRYVDITRPVVIHHGSRDTRVPVDNVRWLGKTMRRCEVRVLEDEGHGLMASAAVMGSVLMEISKEWEDWMKVTGHGRKEERGRKGASHR